MTTRQHFDIAQFDAIDKSSLPPDGGTDFNRLIFSQSPYLLQHAANPVDWYPWCDEVFARARQEDKPVFLSIGYSTCHWCHVMAHESFEDAGVAEVLQQSYLAVKVDREERPDIDNIYMNACQLMTGGGGWPLTLVLTPDKKPFFAATYLPREPRRGMYGLINLLEKIAELWQHNRGEILQTGDQLAVALQRMEQRPTSASADLDDRLLRKALGDYRNSFDRRSGGFGPAPKFPAPHNLSLLLRLAQRLDAPDASHMACATLSAIRAGGVYDQFGYGLHRYSVDAHWQVPHFEKMLYDQALFIHAALDAWQQTGDQDYADMVSDTASYLLTELADPQGGFHSGEDADSEGAEGTYYLWTPSEVAEVLDKELCELVCRCYGITAAGNFEGRSIPHLATPLNEQAEQLGMTGEELRERLEPARQALLAKRRQRIRPHRDDKILACWNGLAISALARAGAVMNETSWLAAAERAATFILEQMVDERGRLLRSWRRGRAEVPGFADDYAFLAWGLLELYQAGFAPERLAECIDWCRQAIELFGDGHGDILDTGQDAEQVLGRGRSTVDGAIPAAGSVLAGVLLRLADLTGDPEIAKLGEDVLRGRLGHAAGQPTAFSQLLATLDYRLGPHQQLVICAADNLAQAEGFLLECRRRFLPRLVSLVAAPGMTGLETLTTLLEGRSATDGAVAYLCSSQTCQPPVTYTRELGALLDQVLRRGIKPV